MAFVFICVVVEIGLFVLKTSNYIISAYFSLENDENDPLTCKIIMHYVSTVEYVYFTSLTRIQFLLEMQFHGCFGFLLKLLLPGLICFCLKTLPLLLLTIMLVHISKNYFQKVRKYPLYFPSLQDE